MDIGSVAGIHIPRKFLRFFCLLQGIEYILMVKRFSEASMVTIGLPVCTMDIHIALILDHLAFMKVEIVHLACLFAASRNKQSNVPIVIGQKASIIRVGLLL